MVLAKKLIQARHCDGLPKITDFRLETEKLPELEDGGLLILEICKLILYFSLIFFVLSTYFTDVLIEAIYLSIDAGAHLPLGSTINGSQIAK